MKKKKISRKNTFKKKREKTRRDLKEEMFEKITTRRLLGCKRDEEK